MLQQSRCIIVIIRQQVRSDDQRERLRDQPVLRIYLLLRTHF